MSRVTAATSLETSGRPTDRVESGPGSAKPVPWARRLLFGLGALALVTTGVPFAFEAGRMATAGPVNLFGDNALIGLATNGAAHLQQALGPYDRFGWHHPGPVYFYLLLFPTWIFGLSTGVWVGASLINGATAVALVGVAWRRAGAVAGLWAAVCLGFLAIAAGTQTFADAWNPFVVIIPLALFIMLCGGAVAGRSLLSLAGAALAGSFAVQTNVGTAPVVGTVFLVVVLVTLGPIIVRRRRSLADLGVPMRGSPWRVVALAAALVGVVVIWIPPIVEEVTGHPGNLTELWRFFTASHAHHALRPSVDALGSMQGLLSFGINSRSGGVLQGPHPTAVVIGIFVVAGLAVGVGWVRGQRLGMALGGASLLAEAASVIAITRIVGPFSSYLFVWSLAVPLVVVIALGVAVVGTRAPVDMGTRRGALSRGSATGWLPGAIAGAVLAMGALVVSVVFSVQASRQPALFAEWIQVNTGAAWTLVAPQLREGETVFLDMRWHDSWSIAAGLASAMVEHGEHAKVAPSWGLLFGSRQVSGQVGAHVIALYQAAHPPATPPPGFVRLGQANDTVLYLSNQGSPMAPVPLAPGG